MKNNKGIIIGIVVVILAVGGAVALTSNSKTDAPSDASMSSSEDSMSMNSSGSMSENESSAASETPSATNTVEIKDYAYSPKAITVKVGTTVTWTNQDSVRHDVVSDKESPDAPKSELLAKGESYSFTFKKAGDYSIHCTPHPYMKATITVTE